MPKAWRQYDTSDRAMEHILEQHYKLRQLLISGDRQDERLPVVAEYEISDYDIERFPELAKAVLITIFPKDPIEHVIDDFDNPLTADQIVWFVDCVD
jgi:hypothetical protein